MRVREEHARRHVGQQRLAHLDQREEERQVGRVVDLGAPAHRHHPRLARPRGLLGGVGRRVGVRCRGSGLVGRVGLVVVVLCGHRAQVKLVQHLHEALHQLAKDAIAHGEAARVLRRAVRHERAVAAAAPAEAAPVRLRALRRVEQRQPQVIDVLAARGGVVAERRDEEGLVDEALQQLAHRVALWEQRHEQLLQRGRVAPPLDGHEAERRELAHDELQQPVQRLHRVRVDRAQLAEHLRERLEEDGQQLLRVDLGAAARALDVPQRAVLEERVGARADDVQLLPQQRLVAVDAHRPGERAEVAQRQRDAPAALVARLAVPASAAAAAAAAAAALADERADLAAQEGVDLARARLVARQARRLAEQPAERRERVAHQVADDVAEVAVVVVGEGEQRLPEVLDVREQQAVPQPLVGAVEAAVLLVVAREEAQVAPEQVERRARHRVPLEVAARLLHHAQALDHALPDAPDLVLRRLDDVQHAVDALERARLLGRLLLGARLEDVEALAVELALLVDRVLPRLDGEEGPQLAQDAHAVAAHRRVVPGGGLALAQILPVDLHDARVALPVALGHGREEHRLERRAVGRVGLELERQKQRVEAELAHLAALAVSPEDADAHLDDRLRVLRHLVQRQLPLHRVLLDVRLHEAQQLLAQRLHLGLVAPLARERMAQDARDGAALLGRRARRARGRGGTRRRGR